MQLLGERILVKYVPKSTIIISENIDLDKIVEGEIAAIGTKISPETGCDELKVGDHIQWSAFAAQWTKIEGKSYGIIRPSDVICKLEKKK